MGRDPGAQVYIWLRKYQSGCGLRAVTLQQGWVLPGCPEMRRPEVRGQQAAGQVVAADSIRNKVNLATPWIRAEQGRQAWVLLPAIFVETCSCRGRWELQSLLCIPKLPLWEFEGGSEGRSQRHLLKLVIWVKMAFTTLVTCPCILLGWTTESGARTQGMRGSGI